MSDYTVIGIVIVVVVALLVGGRLVIRSGKHSVEVGRNEPASSAQTMEASGKGSSIENARQGTSGDGAEQKMSARKGGRLKDVSQDS